MDAARTPSNGLPPRTVVSIVVSYNSAKYLHACLASLERQEDVANEIHVVDNASSDGGVELVRRDFPNVHVHANFSNVGFAQANNQVLEQRSSRFYVLVNPDTVLPSKALSTCVDFLLGNPSVGVVGTRLVSPDGSPQPSCHSFLGLRNLLGETFGAHRLLRGLRPLSSFHMPDFQHDRVAEVDWIQGAFLVLRGDVVRAVGALDPTFFMYGEEMDWCLRARRAGWTVVFLPEPAVEHAGGGSSTPIAGAMFVENLKGRVRFLRKHRGPMVAAAARILIATSVCIRFVSREVHALTLAIRGRAPEEALRLDRSRFRAAFRWILRGLPLDAPDLPTQPKVPS